MITTTHGLMDETLLEKKEGVVDTDVEHTTWVEYCLRGCPGPAHQTGTADAPTHFCSQHVHRSAHITLKRPLSAFGEAASLGG
jgi:hypothetical protein